MVSALGSYLVLLQFLNIEYFCYKGGEELFGLARYKWLLHGKLEMKTNIL